MVEYKYKELTSSIINAAHTVHNTTFKATGLKVGLIINFGPSVEIKRMVL